MMKITYIKLLTFIALSFSFLFSNKLEHIKDNISEIRQEFNQYYDSEKFDRALEFLQMEDENPQMEDENLQMEDDG